jgi:hypothetical protein
MGCFKVDLDVYLKKLMNITMKYCVTCFLTQDRTFLPRSHLLVSFIYTPVFCIHFGTL